MKKIFTHFFNIKKQHLILYFIIICIFALVSIPTRVGDGLEYVAMTKALSEFRLPIYSTAELQDFYRWSDIQPYPGFKDTRLEFPSLIGFDGKQDFPHFWFYSLLAVPFWWLLNFLNLPVMHAFTLLNITLIAIALRIGLSVYSPINLCFTIASPIIWFFNKAHTEVFTFSLVMMGVTLASKGRFLLAATAFAVASTQNIPWIPLVFILCSISVIQKSYFFKSIISRNLFITKRRISYIINYRKKDLLQYLTLFLFNLALSLLHSIYYFIRIKTITPQLASGAADTSSSFPSLTHYFAVLIDPDIGLLPNLPLQSLITIFTMLVILLPKIFFTVFNNKKYNLNNQIWTALGFTLFSLWLLYSFAKTTNFNHGATLNISRYAIWLIPMLMPYWDIFLNHPLVVSNSFVGKFLNSSSSIIFLFYLITCSPFLPETYLFQTLFSENIYNLLPCIYQPVPEIFIERNLNRETPPEASVANSSCSLSYIKYGVFPGNCAYEKSELVAIENYLNLGKTDAWVIHKGTLNLCKSQVVPFNNRNITNDLNWDLSELNLLDSNSSKSFLTITGLSNIEENKSSKWRWGLGPNTNLVFKLNHPQLLNLYFKFDNPIENQDVIIEVNKVILESFKNLNKDNNLEYYVKLQAVKGINRIVFKYKDWNKNQTTFAQNDPRPISVSFRQLEIKPARENSKVE